MELVKDFVSVDQDREYATLNFAYSPSNIQTLLNMSDGKTRNPAAGDLNSTTLVDKPHESENTSDDKINGKGVSVLLKQKNSLGVEDPETIWRSYNKRQLLVPSLRSSRKRLQFEAEIIEDEATAEMER